ncbi:Protein of unknown function [Propionibacterium freudenreichii]|jgi:hypothetical protein
MTC